MSETENLIYTFMNYKRKLNKTLIYAKKIRAINKLGGNCSECGESNIHKLCFHHIDPKEKDYEFSYFKYNRWSIIDMEIDKCQLLCHNCHSELHSSKIKNTHKEQNKKIYLEYKKVFNCEICGYNKCIDSIQFHHKTDEKNFEFRKITKKIRDINSISNNRIKKELDICMVICNNCHCEIHADVEFYENNKELILLKSINMRENSKPLDINIVENMYNSGASVKEMIILLKCKKTAIYDAIKKIRNNS